ncbi:hypothetical protein Pmar_PMAR026268 [Perkinsus marinus ATCC 50983]|uniref:Uncharacterized protein n=1 Tax=Perkinsus marinus (strain ATCC 50983 / TXsc) TaxID=423536 RepID=C5LI56_PERM5|nr:hypothetical protein Pmar_PMAR026268 [Perkinsus marinus ATCC 50983]EER03591.1 hypothetical protein Pmar_PMAR026268 [Perkinsus marinus ATCC 50983]|eukprot:XP_002771775.1 hypothetical protein Pmar_PMAR026268 [Perkinsus marinus ATCC 50983]
MLARSTILLLTLGLAMSDTCQDICDSNPACAQSKFGSYCKSNGVCFGLYHQGCGYCFQPAEQETCDDSTLEPVACQGCQAACDTLPQCKNSDRGTYWYHVSSFLMERLSCDGYTGKGGFSSINPPLSPLIETYQLFKKFI